MINKKIFWTLMFLLVISLLSVVVFARPPPMLCCDQSTDCVIWKKCVASGTSSYDVDGDYDNDYCLNSYWWDCGSDSQCPGNQWCSGSGGSPRYDCKADLGLCSSCNRDAQCASGTTCINSKCRIAATETGLCSNGIDDDCDGLTDCVGAGDPDCNCCGGEEAVCCGSAPVCNDGLYCDNSYCCPSKTYWNGAKCADANPCGISGSVASDGKCYVAITTNLLGWLADPDCYQSSFSLGCCYGFQYDDWNYWPEDITTY